MKIHRRRRFVTVVAVAVSGVWPALGATPARAEATASERGRIERLIVFVASQKDAQFVRNGTAYSASDAAAFLRAKFEKMGDGVSTAQQFIEQIASRSSMSGEAYVMRWPDGRAQPAAQVLRSELERMPR